MLRTIDEHELLVLKLANDINQIVIGHDRSIALSALLTLLGVALLQAPDNQPEPVAIIFECIPGALDIIAEASTFQPMRES